MRNKLFYTLILVVLVSSGTAISVSAQKEKSKTKASGLSKKGQVQLFNGKDLSNWVFKLKDASVVPSGVFTVQNGVIHITGDPFGYMRTKEAYSDYRLHVEWRYPLEASNSGVFVHTQLPDTIWPRCIECQLKAGSAGDFVCMNGADINERTDKSNRSVKKINASNEKPIGEWNTMEVVCKTNTIEVYVNGTLQNKATGVTVSKGYICLQSEGKDIEFRNVFLIKLKKQAAETRNE
jgi:hypothetical protein